MTDIKNRLIEYANTKSGRSFQYVTDKQLVEDIEKQFQPTFFFKTKALTIRKMAALLLLDNNEPVCEHCGASVADRFPWKPHQTTQDRITQYGAWARTCSASCNQHMIEKDGTRSASTFVKYGVDNVMQKPGFAKDAVKNRKTDWTKVGINRQRSELLSRGVDKSFIDDIDFNDPESKVDAIIRVADKFVSEHGREPTRIELCEIIKIHKILLNRWLAAVPKYSDLYHSKQSVSQQQIEIKKFIESLGFECRMSDRTIIHPLEIDLVVDDKKLGIEFCGVWCHSEGYGKDRYYHINKTNRAEKAGYQLLTIYDTEWNDPDGQEVWKSIIRHKLGVTVTKLFARKCELREISSKVSNQFMDENHLQCHVNTTNHIGLFFGDDLVAALSYGKSRTSDQTEIIRMATKRNTVVVGAVSKMIAFVKSRSTSILCFADRRYASAISCGYNSSLPYVGMTGENWWGFKRSEYVLYSRYKFMKHKLKDLFGDSFDPTKTAFQNMMDHKYDRIWDSGNLRYEWNE